MLNTNLLWKSFHLSIHLIYSPYELDLSISIYVLPILDTQLGLQLVVQRELLLRGVDNNVIVGPSRNRDMGLGNIEDLSRKGLAFSSYPI
jgi:hypothetical protein